MIASALSEAMSKSVKEAQHQRVTMRLEVFSKNLSENGSVVLLPSSPNPAIHFDRFEKPVCDLMASKEMRLVSSTTSA